MGNDESMQYLMRRLAAIEERLARIEAGLSPSVYLPNRPPTEADIEMKFRDWEDVMAGEQEKN